MNAPIDQLLNKYNAAGPQPLPQAPQAPQGLAMEQLMNTPPPMSPAPMTIRPEDQEQQPKPVPGL